MEGTTQERREGMDLELLTPEAVAQLLGCGLQTLAAWRSTRPAELPFVKISRQIVRYRRLDIERFIAARVVHAAPERTAA